MRLPILLAAACLALAGCDDSSTGPQGEGTIVVAVTTSGGDPDLDGYELRVDDRIETPFEPSDTETYLVAAGPHQVELTGVASNCAVGGEPTRTVTVQARGSERIEFRVICQWTGVRVSTTSSGLDLDPDGYQITVDGVIKGYVARTGRTQISRLTPGTYAVAVEGVSPNCTLSGPPTRTLTVINARLTDVAFVFTCGAAYGVIEVDVVTVGPRPDNSLTVESSPSPGFEQPGIGAAVTGNGSRILKPMVGVQYLRLMDVAPHCTVEGDNFREVSVSVGSTVRDTAQARFDLTCTEGDATLRMQLSSTGAEIPGAFTLRVSRRLDCTSASCSLELLDMFPIATEGETTVAVPSDAYRVELLVGATCERPPSSARNIDLLPWGTADLQFEVFCERPLLRVGAPTAGTNPDTEYVVDLLDDWITRLGTLAAGETLEVRVPISTQYSYRVKLGGVAANCTVTVPNPSAVFRPDWGEVWDFTFPVSCGP